MPPTTDNLAIELDTAYMTDQRRGMTIGEMISAVKHLQPADEDDITIVIPARIFVTVTDIDALIAFLERHSDAFSGAFPLTEDDTVDYGCRNLECSIGWEDYTAYDIEYGNPTRIGEISES